jgi:hypothetical protein
MAVILLLSLSMFVADDFELPPGILNAFPSVSIEVGFFDSSTDEMLRSQTTDEVEFPGIPLTEDDEIYSPSIEMSDPSGPEEESVLEIWSNNDPREELGESFLFRSESDPDRLLYLVTDDSLVVEFIDDYANGDVIVETMWSGDSANAGEDMPMLRVVSIRTDSLTFEEWRTASSR